MSNVSVEKERLIARVYNKLDRLNKPISDIFFVGIPDHRYDLDLRAFSIQRLEVFIHILDELIKTVERPLVKFLLKTLDENEK